MGNGICIESLGLKELKSFQKIEFISIILLEITIPMSWSLSSYFYGVVLCKRFTKRYFREWFQTESFLI